MKQSLATILIATFSCILFTTPARAELTALHDAELAAVAGQGLVGFSVVGNTARIDMNIDVATYTELGSLKAGYYDDGVNGSGWDQDWTSVSLGSPTQEVALDGLYLEATFTNIDDPATRTLQRFTIGTTDFTGPVDATFNSFSGDVSVDGAPIEGHRITPSFSQLDFDHTAFSFSVVLEGPQQGIWAHWGEAATRP